MAAHLRAEFRTEPPAVQAGQPTTLIVLVKDDQANVVHDLRVVHERPLHLLSVGAEALYRVDQVRKRPLSVRQASHLLRVPPAHRDAWQTAYCARLCTLDPAIARAHTLTQRFADLVRQRSGSEFDAWLGAVQTHGIVALQRFADGLRRDDAAVKAGLTEEWSNGQTEAQINRLKLLKRQMYGRAGFVLLRQRVLHGEQHTVLGYSVVNGQRCGAR